MKLRQIQAHMDAAYVYAGLSYCTRRQVGCVIVDNDRIVSIGYNGTPPGADNTCEDHNNISKPDVIHAEDNAIRKLEKVIPQDSSFHLTDAIMFVTTAPCLQCARKLFDFGIRHVVYDDVYRNTHGIQFLEDRGVIVHQIDTLINNSNNN